MVTIAFQKIENEVIISIQNQINSLVDFKGINYKPSTYLDIVSKRYNRIIRNITSKLSGYRTTTKIDKIRSEFYLTTLDFEEKCKISEALNNLF